MSKDISCDIKCRFTKLSLDISKKVHGYALNEKTAKSIINALNNGMVDGRGEVWLSKNGLNHLLRKGSKKETALELRRFKQHEKTKIDGEEFVKVSTVNKYLLDKTVRIPNNKMLKCIVGVLSEIFFDPVVENQRELYQKEIKSQLKNLGKVRVKEKSIKYDELTNAPLITSGKNKYEFHHIKARNINGHEKYELDIELGLAVNKDTHLIVTKNNCNDEDDLYKLCLAEGWNIDWYDKVKSELEKYK